MKSPFTGKAMQLASEWRNVPFRKETFDLKYQFYLCEDTGEQLTTTELDELNIKMLHNLFRAKHHIPQPDEIKAIRDQYELSAVRMGEVLGFGPNTYGLYEKGDLPSLPNANLLKVASDPSKFLSLAEDWTTDATKAKEALLKKVEKLIKAQEGFLIYFNSYLMGGSTADEYSGFTTPNLAKLTEMIVFFSWMSMCYKTKMNKLLFSISGTRYNAIPMGPVPSNFQSVFEKVATENDIDINYEQFPQGYIGESFRARKDREFNSSVFNETELGVLNLVAKAFKDTSTKQIIDISHEEQGWIDNQESKSVISYNYAIDLKGI
jgi:DNA-binding transcriptional regulator YiaG